MNITELSEVFDLDRPAYTYPLEAKVLFLEEASILLETLLHNRLMVELASSTDPDRPNTKPRVIKNKNPQWYSNFYQSHGRYARRKVRYKYSLVRRDRTVRALKRIIDLKDKTYITKTRFQIDYEIRMIIFDNLTQSFYSEEEQIYIPARLKIIQFYSKEDIIPF